MAIIYVNRYVIYSKASSMNLYESRKAYDGIIYFYVYQELLGSQEKNVHKLLLSRHREMKIPYKAISWDVIAYIKICV